MLTNKDYCDYDTCVALKKLGFPQDYIFARYAEVDKWVEYTSHKKGDLIISEDRFAFTLEDESIVAPLLYEAQKWLRKKRGMHVVPELGLIYRDKNGLTQNYRVLVKDMDSDIIITLYNDRDDFESYEEALSKGIRKAAELLKNKDKQKSPKNS